jgi:hypothetical protein
MSARMRRTAKTERPKATEGIAIPNRKANNFEAVDKGGIYSVI